MGTRPRHLAQRAPDSFDFGVGEAIDFGARMSGGSPMRGFLIVPQMMFAEGSSTFEVEGVRIVLRQLVPLHPEELVAIRSHGPGFFARQRPDIASVTRSAVRLPDERP